jgi:hypothetical protein
MATANQIEDDDLDVDLDQDDGIENRSDDDQADDKTGDHQDDDTHNENDQDDADGETPEEREAIRERRKKERHDRKERQRERENTLKRELAARDQMINELSGRLASVEQKTTSSEMVQIDQAIGQATDAYNYYKIQIADATTRSDGAAMADATEKMMLARQKAEQLTNLKNNYTRGQVSKPAALDPRVANLGQQWLQKNNWYDPNGGDQDSRIAKTIDEGMAREGWNPTNQEYWDELSARVNKYLPHKANSNRMQTSNKSNESRKSVVTGSGRESSSAGSSSYRLSPERVQALKESGFSPESKEYQNIVKAYRAHDKTNSR